MNQAREQLLGYLLGALEPHEQAQLSEELGRSPRLKQEHDRLAECLGRLGFDGEPALVEPPFGLAARACDLVVRGPYAVAPAHSRLSEAMQGEGGFHRRASLADLVVAACVLIAAAVIFFPALASTHLQADIVRCQNNLRDLGVALEGYSQLQQDGSYPRVELQGNRAAAGVYAPTLVSSHLLPDPKKVLCPGSALAQQATEWSVPSLEELDGAAGQSLAEMQQRMGGSYGYSLGHTEGNEYKSPRNRGRAHFAVLGDAPSEQVRGRQSANHRGRGQNMLFEDGHVGFVVLPPRGSALDDPFHNRSGDVAAGLDADDMVLGESAARPFQAPILPVKLP